MSDRHHSIAPNHRSGRMLGTHMRILIRGGAVPTILRLVTCNETEWGTLEQECYRTHTTAARRALCGLRGYISQAGSDLAARMLGVKS